MDAESSGSSRETEHYAGRPPKLPIHLRRYQPSDEDSVWRLHLAGLDQMGANAGIGPWDDDLKQVEDVYLRRGEFLVGEIDDEIVAMGALRPAGGDVAELKRVRVAETFQGHGFGETLSRALLNRARQLGFKRVVLDTTTQQTPAQRLYEKLGFRESHRETGLTGLEIVYYERNLTDWQDESDGSEELSDRP